MCYQREGRRCDNSGHPITCSYRDYLVLANVLDNEKVHIDFKPLYQSIHIYTALESLEELQKFYQNDRKVRIIDSWVGFALTNEILQTQSSLILSSALDLALLSSTTQEITGFFIIEREVLRTTRNFRNARDVEELWDSVILRLTQAIDLALKSETEPEKFLRTKESLLAFIMTLEVCFLLTVPLVIN